MAKLLSLVAARVSAVGLALAIFVGCALADDDAKKTELVARLMALTPIEETAETYMAEYAKAMVASWQVTLADPDAATVEALTQELTRRLVRDYVTLKPILGSIYRDQFTVDELRAVVDFYESPVGRSIRAKERAVNEQIAKTVYPESVKQAEKHWTDSIELLRKQGKKL